MPSSLPERTERHPRLSSMTLVRLPGLEMVARGHEIESSAFRRGSQTDQFGRRKLLVCEHECDHAFRPAGAGATGLGHPAPQKRAPADSLLTRN